MDLIRSVGQVKVVGPMAYTRGDMGDTPWCQVGDYILYPRYSGAKFSYGGVKFLLLNDDEVFQDLPFRLPHSVVIDPQEQASDDEGLVRA